MNALLRRIADWLQGIDNPLLAYLATFAFAAAVLAVVFGTMFGLGYAAHLVSDLISEAHTSSWSIQ